MTRGILSTLPEFLRVFKNFIGVIPRTLTAGGGDPIPHPTPSPAFGRASGSKRPGVGTKTLVPLNFSAVVAPLVTCIILVTHGTALLLTLALFAWSILHLLSVYSRRSGVGLNAIVDL